MGLAYIDWSQQEIGIAAALSGDPALLSAYESGDCYLAFAKQDKAVPPDATEETHPIERDLYKNCALGVGYGMEAESLALRINRPVIVARHLIQRHKEIYRTSWRWGDNAVNHADLHGKQWTVFGWTRWVAAKDYNPRSLRNFHAQAHGAEMLRLACCLGIENGIEICAPVHDAVLICAPVEPSHMTSNRCERSWRKPRESCWAGLLFVPGIRSQFTIRTITGIVAANGCGKRYPLFYGPVSKFVRSISPGQSSIF
jgi:DNA polymerase I